MSHPPSTSGVRVFGKSMHVLAAGWLLSIVWLWISQLQQYVHRDGVAPAGYAAETLAAGIFPAAVVVLGGMAVERWAGSAPTSAMGRREWHHAFWWSIVPNLLLLLAVYVMIQEAK
jgi:hypothetical protein